MSDLNDHQHHNAGHSHERLGDHSCEHGGTVHMHGIHVHGASDRILFAFALNAIFTVIEILGAYQFQSVAVLADAIHDGGDTIALGMAALLQVLALRPPNGQYTFGMRRLSLLAAFLNGLLLVGGSLFVIVKAVLAIGGGHQPVPGGMAALALVGILVNGAAVLRLKGGKSHNERVISLHLLEDVLGWVLVLFTATVMHFAYFPLLDIMLSIGLATFILFRASSNLLKTIKLFLEAVPDGVSLSSVTNSILSVKPILAVHDLHAWSMDGEYNLLACHVVVPNDFSFEAAEELKKVVRSALVKQGIAHVTIEIERESEDCGFEHTHGERKLPNQKDKTGEHHDHDHGGCNHKHH